MILLYQITHNNTDTTLLDLFVTAPVTTTRGHNLKFFKLRTLLFSLPSEHLFLHELLITGISYHPMYPVVNAGSINPFKNLLDNFYSDKLLIVP